MSKNNWSSIKVKWVAYVLKHFDSFSEAIDYINGYEYCDLDVTKGSVRKSLKRYDYKPPSSWLESGEGWEKNEIVGFEEFYEEETGEDFNFEPYLSDDASGNSSGNCSSSCDGGLTFDYEYDWHIDRKNEEYVCTDNKHGYTASLDFETVEEIFVRFSNQSPGQGQTKGEIIDWLCTNPETKDITLVQDENALKRLFDTWNFTKSWFPAPPHLDSGDDDKVAKKVYQRGDIVRKQLLEEKYDESHNLKRSLEDAQKQLLEFRKVFQLSEGGSAKNAEYKIVESKSYPESKEYYLGFIGDLHAGKEEIQKKLANTSNEFSRKIFKERVREASRIHRREIEKVKNLGAVYLSNLGDSFEAFLENMRKGQSYTMYGSPQSNFDDVIWAHVTFVQAVQAAVGNTVPIYLDIHGGNHDRFGESRVPSTEEFMAYIITAHLKEVFKDTENVHITEAAPVSSRLLPNGLNLITMHGHKNSIRQSNIGDAIDVHGFDEADRYLVVQGHQHELHVFETRSDKGLGMVIPSFVGGDSYVTNHWFKDTKARTIGVVTDKKDELIKGPFQLEDIKKEI